MGLANEAHVDRSLLTLADIGVEIVSTVFFFLGYRGFPTTVPVDASCHLSLMPYPLQMIFNLVHLWQKGFCSSHLYPASLQVQQPVRVRLCIVAIVRKRSQSGMNPLFSQALSNEVIVRLRKYHLIAERYVTVQSKFFDLHIE